MTQALILAHGQPSDPLPAAAELDRLAEAVAPHLPGWQVGAATLAEPGAIDRALARLGPRGYAYPLFMSCGWFTGTHLPARLAAAGGAGWKILPAAGCTDAVQGLAVTFATEAIAAGATGGLILAAHGSGRSPAPARIARHVARLIHQATGARVEPAFIEEEPTIETVARGFGPDAACLPYFAMGGTHVGADLPRALQAADFAGPLLPPVGADPRLPGLIARALQAAAA